MIDLSSTTVVNILTAGGWYRSRRIDVRGLLTLLSAAGYPIWKSVSEFLCEFGMLRFHNADAQPPAAVDWHFCPDILLAGAAPQTMAEVERRVGLPVCVIGAASNDHMMLYMDPRSRVYAAYGDYVYLIGASGPDALVALIEGRTVNGL